MASTPRKDPRISVVLPVYNGATYLAETLDTIVMQTCKDWEVILMDGASKDGTLEIARRYAEQYPNIRIYSAPDEGQYDAIHKGFTHARGEFAYVLCAADGYLEKRWFEMCLEVLDKDPEVSLVWGIPFDRGEDGKLIGPHFATAHFLPGGKGRIQFLKEAVRRLARPSSLLRTLRKMDASQFGAAKSALKGERPPQKKDWFFYWLKTGLIFPDNNMCVVKKIYQEGLIPYRPGSRETGDWMQFYFNFNRRGYLSRCIPIPASYARIGAATMKISYRARDYNDSVHMVYFKHLAALREEMLAHPERMAFRDREGKVIK